MPKTSLPYQVVSLQDCVLQDMRNSGRPCCLKVLWHVIDFGNGIATELDCLPCFVRPMCDYRITDNKNGNKLFPTLHPNSPQ